MVHLLGVSYKQANHLVDLKNIFLGYYKHYVSLNPFKYVFAITISKLIVLIISKEGIWVNPKRVKSILEILPPKTPNLDQIIFRETWILIEFLRKLCLECQTTYGPPQKAFVSTELATWIGAMHRIKCLKDFHPQRLFSDW